MIKASLVAIVALVAIASLRPQPHVRSLSVVHVDASEISYRGVFVESVEGATCPDSPCFYL
jgi:hypothetical protein